MNNFRQWFSSNKENGRRYKARKMKRVFQWRRYLDWQNLSIEDKLSVKRLLLTPFIACFLIYFINKYVLTISFLIFIYLAFKKFENINKIK